MFQRRDELDPGEWGEYGPNFVVYGVAGEGELLEIEKSLRPLAVSFHEPDLGGRLTAIAYLGPPLEGFDELSLL